MKNKTHLILLSVLLFVSYASTALANIASGWATPAKPGGVADDVDSAFINMTNWILGFISILAVLFVIWGGVMYLTSAGDENKAESGKKTITYALLGIVIAGLAYAMIKIIVGTILI
ncbi:hypothetical protein KAJ41_00635 [Candidatus Parcubacteria bacterium]|nr:hypothetical protein [Candidatus Parcubacteria bacterium]